jgi:hypothetical protein
VAVQNTRVQAAQPQPTPEKKKGVFGKIVGIFKGNEDNSPSSSSPK